jgi:hypothetical protein
MTMPRLLFPALLTIGLSSISVCQVQQAQGAYDFKIKFVKGKTAKFNNSVVAAAGIRVEVPIMIKVISTGNGRATIETTTGPGKLNGRAQQDKPVVEQTVVDAYGKPVGGKEVSGSIFGGLPGKPVKPGQTWTGKPPLPENQLGLKSVIATYKFVGPKVVSGKKVAHITISLKGTGESTLSGSGTVYVDMGDGLLNSSDISVALTMGSGSQPLKFSAKTVRTG